MIIDLEHIELEDGERAYIKQEGKVTLKVVKITESKSQNNNPIIKVHFQDKIGRFAIDDFTITQNALWKLKAFTKALKMPNMIDTNLMIDRYVIADFKAKKTTNGGEIFEIKKYEASSLTNTMEKMPIPTTYENMQQNHQNTHTQQMPQAQAPIDIDEDEIPF